MASTSTNYSLLAIPAYYVFSVLPHAYAGAILSANGYNVNNANPRASLSPSAVQGKVPDAVFQKYQRAESAQSNNMEQMPLFIAAILASIIAERSTVSGLGNTMSGQDATGLTSFIGTWFAVRAVYCIAYVQTSDPTISYFRSTMWAIGTGLASYQIYKAAQIIG